MEMSRDCLACDYPSLGPTVRQSDYPEHGQNALFEGILGGLSRSCSHGGSPVSNLFGELARARERTVQHQPAGARDALAYNAISPDTPASLIRLAVDCAG